LNKVYFKDGDIVLFCWRAGIGRWAKGKIVGNNFAMCHDSDYIGMAVYYITKLDENNNVMYDTKSYAVEMDSKLICEYKDEYEWCIGKSISDVPYPRAKDPMLDDEKRCLEPYDIIMVNYNGTWELDMFQNYINKDRTQIHTFKGHLILFDDNWDVYDDEKFKQLFNLDDNYVTKGAPDKIGNIDKTVYIPYTSCPELSEDDHAHGDAVKVVGNEHNPDYYYWTTSATTDTTNDNEVKNSNTILRRLDYIEEVLFELTKQVEKLAEKIDDAMEKQSHYPDYVPIPTYPFPYSPTPQPIEPWYDRNKIYCGDDYTTYTSNHIYTAHIKPEDMDKYKEMFTSTSTDKFNYKKYNDMSTCNDTKDSTCYEPKKATSLIDDKYDDKYDTWGLSCAAGKITDDKKEDSND
jgi:hypothetical protein